MKDGELSLRAFWKRSVRLTQALLLLGAALLYLCAPNGRALALGLLLGGIVSVLRFKARYAALRCAGGAGMLVGARLLGYGLSALALALAFTQPETFSPWSTVGGLVTMNFCVVAAELFWKEDPARRPLTGESG